MQVIVNEQNKAYILKQQVAEGYTLDDKTQVVKNGLVYNKADDAPVAANPTNINNWVPVGTDFSGDIDDLDSRIDTLETFKTNVAKNLDLQSTSGLEYDNNSHLQVKVAPDTDTWFNPLVLDEGGLKAPSYLLREVKAEDVAEGYASQYEFITVATSGQKVTTKINIPKDQVLQKAEILSVETADTPYIGAKVGDKYIKFVFQNNDTPQYLAVQDLVDVYTADEVYINMTDSNVITLDITAVTSKVSENLNIANLSSTVSGHTAILNGTNNDGLVAQVEENTSDITKLTGLKINNKSISTTSIGTDGKTSYIIQNVNLNGGDVVITGYTKGTASNLVATDTINQALGKLEARVDAAASGGVQTINGISGDVVIESGETNGTISVHQSGSDKVDVAVTGLKSAAFTDSTDYATSAQGSKADSAVQNVTITTSTGYPNNKIVTVTKGDDNAINLEFNCATISDIKGGAYISELPAGGPLVRASILSESFRTLDDAKADKSTTYTKTEVDALFSWVEL